jgi:outer membrane protein assembly factor BamB
MMNDALPKLNDLVFSAFANQVFAMDRYSGEMIWEWKCEHQGYPALLLDGDRLMVSINGYTFCLDPLTGAEVWNNPLKGKGVGVPTLASARGGSTFPPGAAAAAIAAAQASRGTPSQP